jgi:hypothetical protein
MSDKSKQTAAAVAVVMEPAPIPSLTFYAELVAPLAIALELFKAGIPPLDNLTVTKDFIKKKRRVPAPFVSDAVSAVLIEADLQNVRTINTAQALDDQACLDAFIPLARHIDAVRKAVLLIIQGREARLAASAQQIYAVAKAFSRDREATSLGVHVGNMKRSLKGSHRRRIGGTPETPGKEESTNTSIKKQ